MKKIARITLLLLVPAMIMLGCDSTSTGVAPTELEAEAPEAAKSSFTVSGSVYDGGPYITWSSVSGAVEYDITEDFAAGGTNTYTVTGTAANFDVGTTVEVATTNLDKLNAIVGYQVEAVDSNGNVISTSNWVYYKEAGSGGF